MKKETLVDITNECLYQLETTHDNKTLITVFAEELTSWRTVAMYKSGKEIYRLRTPKYIFEYNVEILKIYRKGKMSYQQEEKMKYKLNKGGCICRDSCININTNKCNPIPKDNNNYVECNNYEEF